MRGWSLMDQLSRGPPPRGQFERLSLKPSKTGQDFGEFYFRWLKNSAIEMGKRHRFRKFQTNLISWAL